MRIVKCARGVGGMVAQGARALTAPEAHEALMRVVFQAEREVSSEEVEAREDLVNAPVRVATPDRVTALYVEAAEARGAAQLDSVAMMVTLAVVVMDLMDAQDARVTEVKQVAVVGCGLVTCGSRVMGQTAARVGMVVVVVVVALVVVRTALTPFLVAVYIVVRDVAAAAVVVAAVERALVQEDQEEALHSRS